MTELKLLLFKIFNIVYVQAYIPFWVKNDGSSSGSSSTACSGTGVQIVDGKIVVCNPTNTSESGTTTVNNSLSSVMFILNLMVGIGVIICAFSIVWSALQIALSAGNNQKKTKGYDRLKMALIGFAVFGGLGIVINMIFGLVS